MAAADVSNELEFGQDLSATDPSRRRVALSILDQSPAKARAHIPMLLEAMNDPDAEVRWRAELALGRVGGPGVPGISEGLQHSEARIRRAAAYVLGPMGPKAKAAIPNLLRTARDPEPSVRVWSTMAVGLIEPRNPDALPILSAGLRDTDPDVRRVALRIVIRLGPEAREVIPALTEVLADPHAELRWLACIGFRQIGAVAAAVAPKLVSLLKDADADVRSRAAQALSRMGEAAEPAVKEALASSDPSVQSSARQVLEDIHARRIPDLISNASQTSPDPHAAARTRWYNEAKFGLFIHWGLYSVAHRARPGQLAEWVMDNEKIPVPEYEKLANGFTAAKFDPDSWVQLAKETGVRYMVLTSKHHDGFCLWDTPLTDYNAVKFAPARRDLVGALASAAERGGIKFALYYSFLDWHQPDYERDFPKYVDWMHGQLRELLTRYRVWGLWFDGEWTHSKAEWRGDEVVAMIRELRPLAFVNDRIGRETRGTMPGVDFYTKEQEIPPEALRLQNRPVAWETCQTFGYSWGYNESPDALRSGERLIEELVDVVCKGGNFLLNIGPRPDGTIPEFFQERMKVIGKFLQKNGEAIYGTSRNPFGRALAAGRVSTKGNRLYVFLDELPVDGVALPDLRNGIKRAFVLENGEPLTVKTINGQSMVMGPSTLLDPPFTVVAIELDGAPDVRAP